MKMLNKTAAILAVNEEVCNVCDPIIKYVMEQLDALNYNIQKVSIIADNDTIIASEIEACIKQTDIVMVLGGIGGPYSDIICQVASKVFHQKLVYNEKLTQLLATVNQRSVNIPIHSKVLECSTDINSSVTVYPAVYIQGLFLMVDDLDLLKLCFVNIMIPFLSSLNKKPKLKRILTLNCEQDIMQRIPRKENVNVSYNVIDNDVNVTLISSNISTLRSYEEELEKTLGNDILKHKKDGDDLGDLVYKQINYSHIRSSIEVSSSVLKNVFQNMDQKMSSLVLMVVKIVQSYFT
ncbi:hypothetical protein ILUMI_01999 [Ignelater luminosus]|uniref:MoaB/Mog domain-containing protein n=1 Tax=Ignelater luminosus TaxID=2038154 RepID=A0A8K0DE99_IGNLU|nr:hypothetical protein ILUMI_01999 [Ignelater luminosus]